MDRPSNPPALPVILLALVGSLLGGLPSDAAAACPNEQLRAEDRSTALSDCRAYEMVSPVDKNGGAIQGFEGNSGGGVLQAALDGASVTYSSASSFADPRGAPPTSQYFGRRGVEGWSAENISVPALSGGYGDNPDGVPYQLFSTDLFRGLLLNGERCRGPLSGCPVLGPPLPGSGAPAGYQNYYLRDDQGADFQALLTGPNLAESPLTPEQFELTLAGASPDLNHIVLSTCAALTPEAIEVAGVGGSCDQAEPNLYEWAGSTIHLVNLLPGETEGTPGAALAAQGLAISSDGSRVYFTAEPLGGERNLYLHEGVHTAQVDGAAQVEGGGTFQTASADGSVAFFTKGSTLYRYQAQTEASQPLAEEVLGVLGAAADGSYLYYAAADGLFLWREGKAPLQIALEAATSNYPPTTGSARITPDGTRLAFLSAASLTGYENAGNSEVYLYDAPANAGKGSLTCASCSSLHHPPLGPSAIPGASANGHGERATHTYKPRNLSADGDRLFFDSRDALVATDSNSHQDVYEWEAGGAGTCKKALGCVSLISGGQSAEDSTFIDASADGSGAFFLTGASMLPSDPGSFDLYDAAENGGFPQPPVEIPCDGDACQGLPVEAEDPAIGTATPGLAGNPPVHFPKAHHHKRRHRKRKRKHDRRAAHGGLGGPG